MLLRDRWCLVVGCLNTNNRWPYYVHRAHYLEVVEGGFQETIFTGNDSETANFDMVFHFALDNLSRTSFQWTWNCNVITRFGNVVLSWKKKHIKWAFPEKDTDTDRDFFLKRHWTFFFNNGGNSMALFHLGVLCLNLVLSWFLTVFYLVLLKRSPHLCNL